MSTIVDGDKNRHSVHVCVVCNCLIIGMEKVDIIEKQQSLIYSAKLSVSSYEEYYDGVLCILNWSGSINWLMMISSICCCLLDQDFIRMDTSVVKAVTESWL